jgi:hypothetical protein
MNVLGVVLVFAVPLAFCAGAWWSGIIAARRQRDRDEMGMRARLYDVSNGSPEEETENGVPIMRAW